MYCRNCGSYVELAATACTSCGNRPLDGLQYCQECGKPTNPNQVYCVHCKHDLKFGTRVMNNQQPVNNRVVIDEPNMVANLASACCSNPIVGIILYLVWKDEKPKAAESVCYWTIGGFVASIILGIIYVIFVLAAASSTGYQYA